MIFSNRDYIYSSVILFWTFHCNKHNDAINFWFGCTDLKKYDFFYLLHSFVFHSWAACPDRSDLCDIFAANYACGLLSISKSSCILAELAKKEKEDKKLSSNRKSINLVFYLCFLYRGATGHLFFFGFWRSRWISSFFASYFVLHNGYIRILAIHIYKSSWRSSNNKREQEFYPVGILVAQPDIYLPAFFRGIYLPSKAQYLKRFFLFYIF